MIQYLTWKHHYKPKNKGEIYYIFIVFKVLKLIYNKTLFIIRQKYFKERVLINYYELIKILRQEKVFLYIESTTAMMIIENVYNSFKNFYFNSVENIMPKYIKNNHYFPLIFKNNFKQIKIPTLNKKELTKSEIGDSFLQQAVSFIVDNNISPPIINIPQRINKKEIRYIKLIPLYNHIWLNLLITFRVDIKKEKMNNNSKTMAIDLGVNNFVTAVTSDNKSFIIDGRYLKSISRLYNKKLSIYNKNKKNDNKTTKKIFLLTNKRNNRVKDYILKTARYIISYALKNDIGVIIIGYNKGLQHHGLKENSSKFFKKAINQTLVQTPFLKFKERLKYLCNYNNIEFKEINESFTSICSFYDNEDICYHKIYKGKRIKRGLFLTSDNKMVNADVNGALNILAKSKTNSDLEISHLRNSGILVPKRIFIYDI